MLALNAHYPSVGKKQVQKLLGAASEASWPGVSALPDFGKILFPDYPPQDLADAFPDAADRPLSILADMLALDPARRKSPTQARKVASVSPCCAVVARFSSALRACYPAQVIERHFTGALPPVGLPHWLS